MLLSRAIRIVAATLLVSTALEAQQPVGRIEGQVVDAETKKPIGDAGVQIVGTTLGTMTRSDGKFSIGNIPAGTVTLQVRRLGYQPLTLTGLTLATGETLTQEIALTQAVARVATQIVRAAADRGSIESSLDEQRNAVGVVSSVTAEQIGRSPDANAAQAVQRVSGVTVQDGKYVFVRGLGERYTTTSLNGARVPSPEPERKVVPLDLFPSGLLQSVTTSKTFTPDLPGDFSGAHVDIRTREFPGERQETYGASFGYLSDAWDKHVAFAPGVGGEAFAAAGSARSLPESARRAGDLTGINQQSKNEIINAFRNVWQPGQRSARPNMSLRGSVGGSERLLNRRLGYLVSGTYSYSQDIKANQTRALARAPSTAGDPEVAFNRFDGTTSGESVLWGGLVNVSSLLSPNSRVSVNALYNRTADNDARLERSSYYDDAGGPIEIQRLDYVQRSMWSTQLAGEHDRGRQGLDWSVSGSGVTRSQPDRSEIAFDLVPPTQTPLGRLWRFSGEGAVRTFSELAEHAMEGRATYRRDFGDVNHAVTLKVGGLARGAFRDADTQSYEISAPSMDDTVRALPPEILFGGRFTAPDSSVLNLRSLAQGGSYSAEDGIFAGFTMIDLPLGEALRLITGARVEHSDTRIKARSTIGDPSFTKKLFTDVLPSIALNYRPTYGQAVRFSLSRTLARPEYRELAGIRTREALAGVDQRGNPLLVRTLIDNADLRWEWYPRAGELVSAAVFAKQFHNPIERVLVASNTNPVAEFRNADAATNYGIELEARKGLDALADVLAPLTVFSSVTLMRSEIKLGQAATSLNPNRPMVGQAPYVINGGLTYASANGRGSATLLYNRVGPRIKEAGEQPLPDVRELAQNGLDFSLRLPAGGGIQARFDARNLLNSSYELRQGAVLREAYSIGRTLQIGLTVQR